MAALSVKLMINKKNPWYAAGLNFECVQCGRCCAGPTQGYIWVTRKEIELIANHLNETVSRLRQRFLKRIGLRTTIIEHPTTKDCIFLQKKNGRRTCIIYPVRPSQCRSWPFWPNNLESSDTWDKAAQKCPGINRGKLYSCEEIEQIKKIKKWWLNPTIQTNSLQK
jgi:Fe-S-cluster containining protein